MISRSSRARMRHHSLNTMDKWSNENFSKYSTTPLLHYSATVRMRIAPTFNVALRALRRNKMRSVLTALGIIIGVGAVIAMVGIGNGAKAQVEAQMASLGQHVILIFASSIISS